MRRSDSFRAASNADAAPSVFQTPRCHFTSDIVVVESAGSADDDGGAGDDDGADEVDDGAAAVANDVDDDIDGDVDDVDDDAPLDNGNRCARTGDEGGGLDVGGSCSVQVGALWLVPPALPRT